MLDSENAKHLPHHLLRKTPLSHRDFTVVLTTTRHLRLGGDYQKWLFKKDLTSLNYNSFLSLKQAIWRTFFLFKQVRNIAT